MTFHTAGRLCPQIGSCKSTAYNDVLVHPRPYKYWNAYSGLNVYIILSDYCLYGQLYKYGVGKFCGDSPCFCRAISSAGSSGWRICLESDSICFWGVFLFCLCLACTFQLMVVCFSLIFFLVASSCFMQSLNCLWILSSVFTLLSITFVAPLFSFCAGI